MTKKIVSIILITILFMASQALSASVKERMRARLPEINTLKASGTIGENNKGLLELRVESNQHTELIKAENNDRLLVYKKIAEQQKTTPELVGKRRALQISEKAVKGNWLQDEAGKWFKK